MTAPERQEQAQQPSRQPWFIALCTLGGVVLCAVPFLGGLVGIIGGVTTLSVNRREKKWALLHSSKLPLCPISEVVPGRRVRLQGRVISKPSVTAPVSGRPVVYAIVSGKSSVMRHENERALAPRYLGESIEIEDSSGRATLTLGIAHILSRHVHQHVEHDQGRLAAARELYSVPSNEKLDLVEVCIEAGDELFIEGEVEAVEDVIAERPAGYRASGVERRVKVGSHTGQALYLTNLSLAELERVLASSPSFVVMGVVWLCAAVGSLAYWGWRCFS